MNTDRLSLREIAALFGLVIAMAGLGWPPSSAAASECPNEAFRSGPSAHLPDCRAYEMVTPPNANGRLLEGISTFGFDPTTDMFPTELGSPVRDSFIFMTYNGPLADIQNPSGTFDMYQAQRSEEGWLTTRRLSPSGDQAVIPYPGGVTPGHEFTFLNVSPLDGGKHPGGSLAEGISDYLGLPDGTVEPTGIGSLDTERRAQGRYISDGGDHVIFSTGNVPGQSVWCFGGVQVCTVRQLEPDAAPTGTGAIYDRPAEGGATRVISLLPGDKPAAADEEAVYQGTSKDASAVAFTIKGTLYVRVDNVETLDVSGGEPTYAGFSDDGHYLFYVSGGNIHRFDTETEDDTEVNSTGDGEVVNVSADGSHVYFVSKSQIGGQGQAGEPNLYVWRGGVTDFIATVLVSDLDKTSGINGSYPGLTKWTSWAVNPVEMSVHLSGPGAASSRATPDGTVLAFESRAQLTSYDNDGHTEIYRYDDSDGSLGCVSCNPMIATATDDARFQELELVKPAMVVHNLSDDGSRVFFETSEALVAGDTDGVNDIYQWREEEGGMALDLISTGHSVKYPPLQEMPLYLPSPNILLSVTPDGEDVYFLAQEPLVSGAGEGGTQAIYNARVNGGFAQPVPPPICLEEDCKGPPSGFAPSLPGSPSSEGTRGAGNVKTKPRKGKPRCQRAKHKKPRHCNKKKPSRHPAHGSAAGAQGPVQASGNQEPLGTAASEPLPPELSGENSPSTSATAAEEFPFEIEEFAVEESNTAAGGHPDFTTRVGFTHYINKKTGLPESDARLGDVSVSLPPGLLGNVNSIPKCKTGELLAYGNCPIDSQVGVARVLVTILGGDPVALPLFNLEPPHPDKEVARFGFFAIYPAFIDVKVRTAGDYGATATVHSPPAQAAVLEGQTILWGNPADPIHDELRMTTFEATQCGFACNAPGGKRPSGIKDPKPFTVNPSACQPMPFGLSATSYQRPGEVFSASTEADPITDCQGLPFAPEFEASTSNPAAGAPTGLKTTLRIPRLEDLALPSTATMREARVTLPKGFQINAGAADGIAACSEADVRYHQEEDGNCPDASKVGVASIQSPLLPQPIGAEVFLRDQRAGHPYGLWLVSDELGLHVKIPGELEPDKATGQLTAVFTDLPQAPVSQIDLNVWGGSRAPLTTPEDCGTYTTTWSFKPHSDDPPVTGSSQIKIDQGCGGRGFSPKLHAGTTNPVASAFSPFEFDLVREDSEQNLASLDLTLPDGLLAKLKGVPLCPTEQADSGNCPADSKIGSVTAQAGAGPAPIWIPQPGKAPTAVYLSGPYKGAPFSIAVVVPAQAGPFDLGNVVVRSALRVDPETAKATVVSDPLPQFFEGVGATYRRVHVVVDRPEFMLNPTDCSELAVTSHLVSVKGAVAEPSSRFEVDGCKALKYTPKLRLTLKGGTNRSDHPAVKAVLTQPPGQANTAGATVMLPVSEFIDQDHINNPCTRVQFREDKCPKLSVLGRATAVTPLLGEPLKGPVYFRSNGGERELPDIVADLRGQIHVTVVGFVDAVPIKGTERSRIRTRFATVPDAPVTKFTMNLLGGKKRGLLENSRNLCATNRRAKVVLQAQNGRRIDRNLLIGTSCKDKRK